MGLVSKSIIIDLVFFAVFSSQNKPICLNDIYGLPANVAYAIYALMRPVAKSIFIEL